MGFVDQREVDAVWRAATARVREPLPPRATWPASAPAFFHVPAPDGGRQLFERGLVEAFAVRYYRCTWLEVALDRRTAAQAAARDKAEVAIDRTAAVADRLEVPVASIAPREELRGDAAVTTECSGFTR